MLRIVLASTALFLASVPATAQLISIRTVPVSQAHQFDIFPSRTAAMAGLAIAVADTLRDPFINPAMGVRLGPTRVFGSPSAYSVSGNAGGGRTLPIGVLARASAWYGGVWLGLQQVDMSPRPDLSFIGPLCPSCNSSSLQLDPAEQTQGNTYAFAMAGRTVRPGLSVGGSVLWSHLNGIDGVDLLYAGSARIDQRGEGLDLRLGLLKEWSNDRSLQTIVLHNRFGAEHDVYYLDSVWDPGTGQVVQEPRLEGNFERTRIWGLHLAYEQPLSAAGWRAGAIATVNRMDHPKIPNYEIMSIPRDPGNSSAFNIGLGLSRTLASSKIGIDLIYEPIWSHTWADSETPVQASNGRIIPPGGMTIENRFRFSNSLVRMGLGQHLELGDGGPQGELQLGLVVRGIHYWLKQRNHVQLTSRRHEESWTEWTPTWGFSLRFPELEVRYHGSVTNGTGRPGVVGTLDSRMVFEASVGSNILAAPSGPLTLAEVRVLSHQVSVSLPIH